MSSYFDSLLSQLGQKQIRENISSLGEKMSIEQESCLYPLSKNKSEYVKNCHLFDGTLKTIVDVSKLNMSLLMNATSFLEGKEYVLVAHDVCDIRKEHSKKLEGLGKVKSLDGKIINGYQTYNSVALSFKNPSLRLLGCIPFSNGDAAYVTKAEEEGYQTGQLRKMVGTERYDEVVEHLSSGSAYNQKKIILEQIQSITNHIRSVNSSAAIVSLYDRGFDDQAIFEQEEKMGNLFVIRGKLNRNSNELYIDENGKEKAIKLVHQSFNKGEEICFKKVRIKNKTHTNVTGVFEWNLVDINDHTYNVVRVRLYTATGKCVYKDPMILITNIEVNSLKMAHLVFEFYLQRAKIEGVFKFCKDIFKWEKPRMDDWLAMKNLLTFVYFIAGYFYEIEDQITEDSTCQWLAELGNGKGKVTKHFLLKGLQKIAHFQIMKRYFEQHNQVNQDELSKQVNLLFFRE